MITKTYEKIKAELKQEIMAELILPVLTEAKDREGGYKQAFVKWVIALSKAKPTYCYQPKNFLKLIGGR
ncbi:MAG: hypothetical protein AAB468_00005 [Patescibacteria group bacterium]